MRRSLLSIFGSIWLCGAVFIWMAGHYGYFTHLDEVLLGLVSASWFWLLYASLGWFVVDRWFSDIETLGFRSRLKKLLFSIGIGIGIYSAAILIFGIWVGVSREKIFLFNAGLTVVAGKGWISILKLIQQLIKSVRDHSWNNSEILNLLLIGFVLLGVLPFALTPAVFPDTLRYHFGLTHLYETEGRIRYFADIAESNISLNWQMLFMGQLLTVGEICPQVLTWSSMGIIVLCVMTASHASVRYLAAWFTLAFPFLLSLSTITNNDCGVTLFLAFMWLSIRSTKTTNHWLLAGIFGGIALGIKYSALLAICSFLTAYVLFGNDPLKGRFNIILIFILGMTIGYFPWLIKNTVWTGDPLYPSLSHFLPWAKSEGLHVTQTYAKELAYYGGGMQGFKRWLFGLWRATTENSRYFESELGLVAWACLPLLIYGAWRYRSIRVEILSFLFFIAFWAAGPQITRFLATGIPVFAIAMGEISCELKILRNWRLLRFALTILILGGIWITWLTLSQFSNPYTYFLRRESRDDYLKENNLSYSAAQWLVENDHAKEKLLLIGVEDIYLFKNPIKYSGPFDRKWFVIQSEESKTPQELTDKVRNEGIRYFYVDHQLTQALDRKFDYMDWPNEQSRKIVKLFFLEHTRLLKKEVTGQNFRELRELLP
jgi:hypothetical protein